METEMETEMEILHAGVESRYVVLGFATFATLATREERASHGLGGGKVRPGEGLAGLGWAWLERVGREE